MASERKPRSNKTGKAPTRKSGGSSTGKSLKKLSKTGQSSRTVRDPSATRGNRPRQGAPVLDSSEE